MRRGRAGRPVGDRPVTVSYELTGLGLSLHHLMRGVKEWAETRMDEGLANREEYATMAGDTQSAAAAVAVSR